MDATFRLKRQLRGRGAFAVVSIRAAAAETASVRVLAEVTNIASFRAALEQGARFALDTHSLGGGPPASLEVTALVETAADSSDDSVMCAAAGAAWIALGHAEETVEVNRAPDGLLRVSLSP